MSGTVGIGVVGYGARLAGLIEALPAMNDKLRVVAICDPLPQSLERCRKKFRTGFAVYHDVHQLVTDPNVDWVAIGSWNCCHKEQAVAALDAGKHVFCEKPLATTLEDCVAIAESWRQSERIFSMGFTLRYSAHYHQIKKIIDDGIIGRIISMEFNETLDFNHGGYIMGDWRRLREYAGTHLLEKCCHDIDLVNWITGSLASRVASFGGLNVFRPENHCLQQRLQGDAQGRVPYQAWRSVENLNPFLSTKDIVDNQVAIIEYANGIRATFHTNCNAGITERRMYILGTRGAIRADVLNGTIEVRRVGFDEKTEDFSTTASGGHGDGDKNLIASLQASMLEGTAPLTDAEDGLKSAVTCFGIDDALDNGIVVDMAPYWSRAGVTVTRNEFATV
jgi:predicted dehydrogenase